MPLRGYSGGRTRAARNASAMPQEWKCSTERCVRFCPFGMRCGAVRRSISAQDIPRSPRSTASATPTGPPPTMTTWYCFIAGSFRLDPRRPDDRPPLLDPGPEHGGERLRRLLFARQDLLAEIDEPRAHHGIGQRLHHRGIEPGDDGGGRAPGSEEAVPVLERKPGQAGLVHRRNVGGDL